jgi:hypothetical protein
MNGKRFGIEALIIVVLLLTIASVWWVMDRRAADEREQLEMAWESRAAAAEAATARWTEALAEGEATAVFRAFAAGIHPLVLPERRDTLDQAVAALLELPAIEGVHVLGDDGRVLASSDRKLQTTGRLDDRDAWVLETTELTAREGARAGVVQIASPIVGPSGPAGFLWLAYDAEAARTAARPAG